MSALWFENATIGQYMVDMTEEPVGLFFTCNNDMFSVETSWEYRALTCSGANMLANNCLFTHPIILT